MYGVFRVQWNGMEVNVCVWEQKEINESIVKDKST